MDQVQRFSYMRIVNRMLVADALILAVSYAAYRIGYIDGNGLYIALMFVAIFAVAPFAIAVLERQDERSIVAEPPSETTLASLATGLGAKANRSGNVVTFASIWDASPLRQHMKLYLVEEDGHLRILGPRAAVLKVAEVLERTER